MAAHPVAAVRPVGGSYDAPWRREADAAADRNKLPRQLFRALIGAESGWNAKARSAAGAIGLTQLMPATARGLGVDPTDPRQNLEGGARYLRAQLDRFGDVELALAAYNAGPGRVEDGSWRRIPETRNYVAKVLAAAGDVAVKFEDWVRAGPGADLENTSADLLARLFLLGAASGKPIDAVSGKRTTAEQRRLWENRASNPYPVAEPGSSKHERGAAVDATVGGRPIGEAFTAQELEELGLRTIPDDPVHVETLAGAEVEGGAVGANAALVAAAAIATKLGPKVLTKLRGVLRGIGRGSAKTAGTLAKYGTLGGLLAALDVTGALDLKRAALWLLFTLLGLALIVVGVLRLVGLKPGTVVNVTGGGSG